MTRFSVALALAVVGSMAGLRGQSAPAFEVATVRPSGPESAPMSIQRQPGGRLVTSNMPLSRLIAWAYGLDDGRLLGIPSGADSARFDILALASNADLRPGETQLMMRALLAERFGLTVHSEERTLTTFVLLTDRDRLRVGLTNPPEPPAANPFSMTAPGVLIGRRVTADMLARALSSQLGTAVENRTGVTGSFDFTLEWRPETVQSPDDLRRASLFTAIREQLGFRLEPRSLPVDVIVIDRLSLIPTAN